MNDILRRKMARGGAAGDGGPGADHGWRLAFARAARDASGLLVEVASMSVARRSLAEVLELPPDRALLALLDGPQGGLGLMAVSGEVMSALIEMQTTGRVSAAPILPRRPTRTDAAMVAGVIDRALEELETILAEEADLIWAGGFRYASFLEDPRPLGLLLEDQPYRVLSAELSLAGDVRRGSLLLALPAEGRGKGPLMQGKRAEPKSAVAPGFTTDLGQAVQEAGCRLDAVIGRVTLPLREVMALVPDQVLVLPQATLDQIALEGLDGRRVAWARLGQQKGMRALRLKERVPEAGGMAGPSPGLAAGPAAPPVPMAMEPDPVMDFGMPMDLDGGLLATG
jgi:flagellar motor switch protein FliM